MRITIFITLLLTLYFTNTYAQLTIERLYTKHGVLTTDKEKAYYTKTLYLPDSTRETIFVQETYTSNNNVKLQGMVKDTLANNYFGRMHEFYENGNFKSKKTLTWEAREIDTSYHYHPNGKIESIIYYPYTTTTDSTKIYFSSPLYLLYADSTGKELLIDGVGFAVDRSFAYSEGNYVNHKKEGQWKGYFSDKKYTFIEIFKDNKIISGVATDLVGNEIKYDSATYRNDPVYPGGIGVFMQFVEKNIKYPREAINKNTTDIIEVSFEIDTTGQPKNFRILNEIGDHATDVVLRLMKKMGKWKPGIGRGVPMHIFYTLPIRLNLRQ